MKCGRSARKLYVLIAQAPWSVVTFGYIRGDYNKPTVREYVTMLLPNNSEVSYTVFKTKQLHAWTNFLTTYEGARDDTA